MIGFYKHHMSTIIERSVNPDKRRYINENEGPRHFIDLDAYGSDPLAQLPKKWQEAIEQYGDSTLTEHGIVPWHMVRVKYYLTQAACNSGCRPNFKNIGGFRSLCWRCARALAHDQQL